MLEKNQRGTTGAIGILLIVILGVVTAFAIWQVAKEDEAESNDKASSQVETATEQTPSDETSTPADELRVPGNADLVSLSAVNGYEASGNAQRDDSGETFVHELNMLTGSPAEGKFYEGWLVGPSIVSTGELTEEAPGEWSIGIY